MRKYSLEEVRLVMRAKGYVIFDNTYDLNIFGIRSNESESNKFDDWVGVFCKDDRGKDIFHLFPATTDPGKPWLLSPMRSEGTAIMVPNQYRGLYKLGKHKDYEALEQKENAQYVRDSSKDSKLDFSLYKDKGRLSIYGRWENAKTNIHRASSFKILQTVETYSAGCQVLQSAKDFNTLLDLCKKQIQHTNINSFTYTLLEEF
jgi:hypothetical protein